MLQSCFKRSSRVIESRLHLTDLVLPFLLKQLEHSALKVTLGHRHTPVVLLVINKITALALLLRIDEAPEIVINIRVVSIFSS